MGRIVAVLLSLAGLALALDAGWTLVAAPFVDGVPLPPATVLTATTVFLLGTVLATRGLVGLTEHRLG